jgi:hypothetical protein
MRYSCTGHYGSEYDLCSIVFSEQSSFRLENFVPVTILAAEASSRLSVPVKGFVMRYARGSNANGNIENDKAATGEDPKG